MLYCKTFASIFIGSPMQNLDKAYERPPHSRYVLQVVLLFQIFSFSFVIWAIGCNYFWIGDRPPTIVRRTFHKALQSPLTRHASENRENQARKYEFIHKFISVMLKLLNGICTDTSAFTNTNKTPSTHGSGGAVERFVHTFNWSTLHTDGGIRL